MFSKPVLHLIKNMNEEYDGQDNSKWINPKARGKIDIVLSLNQGPLIFPKGESRA